MRIYNPTTSSGGGGEIGATGPAGPLPWEFMGAYDNGYSYPLNKAVTYQGGYYYRTGNPLNPGYPPTPGSINESWTPVADGGIAGATGPQGLQGPGGGGGAGGLMFYLNQNTSPDSPLTGLPTSSSVVTGFAVKELGRIADTVQSTITSSNLPTDDFNIVAAFLSDEQDPNITSIPPGLWDVNFWASSTANTNNQTVIRVIAYKYNGTSKTEIARSDDMYIYDPVVIAQYTANIVVRAGIAITANDRIYIEILAKGTSNNYTVTLKFGGNTPAHVHTTIPSVSGTGLVKVENGLFNPQASLLVDADISADAAISLSKISGAASSANVQIFSTPGTFTWTKPAGATAVEIQLLAGGGGGGSGRKDASTTAVVKCGGGGGGGGSWLNVTLNADALDATVEVTVGGGGNGGAAQSSNADGNNGSAGGNTIFGSIIALGGNFGSGGTINTGTGGLASLNSNAGASAAVNGGSGGGGFPSGITVAWMFGGAGGGAGGGISSSNSSFAGGAGGRSNALNLTGGTLGSGVGTNGGAGSANTNASAGLIAVGSGGGGGGSSATVNGGSGGAGGFPSGGGGGGGATTAGTSSGAGGAGAAGIAIITTYF